MALHTETRQYSVQTVPNQPNMVRIPTNCPNCGAENTVFIAADHFTNITCACGAALQLMGTGAGLWTYEKEKVYGTPTLSLSGSMLSGSMLSLISGSPMLVDFSPFGLTHDIPHINPTPAPVIYIHHPINGAFCACGSQLCRACGRCTAGEHPKEPDGSVIKVGWGCPYRKVEPVDEFKSFIEANA